MRKAEMKRTFFQLAADALAGYEDVPAELIGDRVGIARWFEARDDVVDRLRRLATPRSTPRKDPS